MAELCADVDLPQARHRGAVPDPRDRPAPAHRLLRRRRVRSATAHRPSRRPAGCACTATSAATAREHFDEFDVPVGPRHDAARRAALDPAPPRPVAGAAPLLPARLVRHLRRAGRRPRGARVRRARSPTTATRSPSSRWPTCRSSPTSSSTWTSSTRASPTSTRSCAPARSCPRPSRPTASPATCASRTASSAGCACRPARSPRRRDEYVGPAALAAAQRLLEEPRGADREDVLAWAGRPEGVWRCHVGLRVHESVPGRRAPGRAHHGAAPRADLDGHDARRHAMSAR